MADLSQARAQLLSVFLDADPNQVVAQPKSATKPQAQTTVIDLDAAKKLAAMNLAEHGKDAIPALKMALGSDEKQLRSGAILTLEQMYRAERIDRNELFETVLGYYGDSNTDLRRGALEWFEKMHQQLPKDRQMRVFETLETSFGAQAEDCNKQTKEVSLEAARFLFFSPVDNSAEFLKGMVTHCSYDNVRAAAIEALSVVAESLPSQQQNEITHFLRSVLGTATGPFSFARNETCYLLWQSLICGMKKPCERVRQCGGPFW